MESSLIALIVLSLFLGCGCWLVFLWAVQKGEFSDIERPKHRMLLDDEGDENKSKHQVKSGSRG
jgi:cbb3-type cytochrome oxidase maturation protein